MASELLTKRVRIYKSLLPVVKKIKQANQFDYLALQTYLNRGHLITLNQDLKTGLTMQTIQIEKDTQDLIDKMISESNKSNQEIINLIIFNYNRS